MSHSATTLQTIDYTFATILYGPAIIVQLSVNKQTMGIIQCMAYYDEQARLTKTFFIYSSIPRYKLLKEMRY